MSEVSRRSFLKGGSAAVVAAGAIAALPGLPAVLGGAETTAPGDAGAAASAVAGLAGSSESLGGQGSLSEPLIAHVRDLATGEIGLFSGTREITVMVPDLTARLARAIS